jgi:hypothetical protein
VGGKKVSVVGVLAPLLLWCAIGALLFNVYVVVVFRTGIVYTARDRDGALKREVSLSGAANSALLLGMIVGLQVAALAATFRAEGPVGYGRLYLFAYTLYLLLGLYDTAVIDYGVIVRWRPAFLRIPDEMNVASMRAHIRASTLVVPLIGLPLTAISAAVARLWLR